ncbi:hypothetical protein [Vibrio parahaemolyticus]|uniref:hypothetical protein n=1 Tax=Vibrio parahaemolyticus TaxID=670 RepID=UPI0021539D81|nr:hypothetical protein [Vibrio parahaemolyticus]MDF4718969.1 hypothetical protein [Vibrio parahaemolyticus]
MLWFLSWFGFSASEAALLVESLLCCFAVPKGLFGVQSPFFLRRCKFQVVSVTGALKLRLIWVS